MRSNGACLLAKRPLQAMHFYLDKNRIPSSNPAKGQRIHLVLNQIPTILVDEV